MISTHIDHTNLKPFATDVDIQRLCDEALVHKFRGVCVNPRHVTTARVHLDRQNDPHIPVVTVVGFPLGANQTQTKIQEACHALSNGAEEIDVVWDLAAFKMQEYWLTLIELTKIVRAVLQKKPKTVIKVIVEECYLDSDELEKAFSIVASSGAHYIKTSTGMGKSGAKLSTIALWAHLRKLGGIDLGIKASGGIKTHYDAKQFIAVGASAIGTSHGVSIVRGEGDYAGH